MWSAAARHPVHVHRRSILSEVDFRTILDKTCFTIFYTAHRIPATIYIVLRLIGIDPIVTGVSVLSSAMPAATMTAMLSAKYGRIPSCLKTDLRLNAVIARTLPAVLRS